MVDSFKLVGRLFSKANSARLNLSILNKLRKANPGSTIMSANLHDVSLGEYVAILDRVYLNQVRIGNFSYISNDSTLTNVTIGHFCSIGPHVQIGLGPHPTKVFVSTYPAFYTNKISGCPRSFRNNKIFDDSIPTTKIANDVWIGSNVIIPGGIDIGNGAIVAAGSVVVKNIPPYAVVGGNPAKLIRYRFPADQIDMLLKTEWWDWPIEKIISNVDKFSDINKFKDD